MAKANKKIQRTQKAAPLIWALGCIREAYLMGRKLKLQKYGLFAGLLILAFIYGVGVGSGQWFPYSFLKDAKNALIESRQNEVQSQVADNNRIIFGSLRDDTEYHVVLLAGQSNMVGKGDVNSLGIEDQQLPPNIEYFNFGYGSSLNYNPHKFGPEVSLSQQLHSLFPNKHFVLIKYAVDGSSLLDWSPNWSYEKAKVTGNPHFGPLYEKFLNRVSTITKGKSVTFSALLWMQGERDARIPEDGKTITQIYQTLYRSYDQT